MEKEERNKKEERYNGLLRKYVDDRVTSEEWKEAKFLHMELYGVELDLTPPKFAPSEGEPIELIEVVEEPKKAEPAPKVTEPEREVKPLGPRRSIRGVLRGISESPLLPWIIVVVLAVFGFFSTIGWVGGYRRVKELEEALKAAKVAVPAIAAATPATVAPTTPTPAPAPKVQLTVVTQQDQPELYKKLDDLVVGTAKGIEHSFIRQLVEEYKDFGFDGDPKDKGTVRTWAEKRADQYAIQGKYVEFLSGKKTGREIRVKTPDKVAYMLVKDKDGVKATEWVKTSKGFEFVEARVIKEADGLIYMKEHYELEEKDSIQDYEYVYGGSAPQKAASNTLNINSAPSLGAAMDQNITSSSTTQISNLFTFDFDLHGFVWREEGMC